MRQAFLNGKIYKQNRLSLEMTALAILRLLANNFSSERGKSLLLLR